MTLYNTKPVLLLLIPILMLHRNSDTSFQLPNFSSPYANSLITYQGDAFATSRGGIQLTKIQNGTIITNSAGRATYALPVRIWDAKTGKVARFTSNFTFDISSGGPNTGDGISFFLAPFKSGMPQDSEGGYLGLFSPDTGFRNSELNQIVAVEFDTYSNDWDPAGAHIGIDVNSIQSVRTEEWVTIGVPTVFATVTYDPVVKSLSVVVLNIGSTISLSFEIDLKTYLPEFVSVGFSGATGHRTELHKIQSWSFSSSFD